MALVGTRSSGTSVVALLPGDQFLVSARGVAAATTHRTRLTLGRRKISCMASTAAVDSVPSWQVLSEKLDSLGDVTVMAERLPNAKQRDFGAKDSSMVVFYRDNSSWCPYCERVWLQLEEKKIPYRVEKINMRCYGPKPDWFLKMVPSGLLPVVELNGRVVTESLDIMMILEDSFPDHKKLLPPTNSPEGKAVDGLLRLERILAGAWLSRLRSFWSIKGQFEGAMDDVDAALSRFGGPYFLGKEFSLVDAVYAPFLERVAASMPYWQGVMIRGESRWPHLQSWFDAMDSRPTFQAVKSDDFTIVHTLEPQIGPCRSLPAGEAYRERINGRDGSWDLPLRPETSAWGRDDGNGNKAEAAKTLVGNNEAVVSFALRGVENGELYRDAVDLGLRYVAQALVVGVENVSPPVAENLPEQVAKAAGYLRDRVGVPRDLSYPAARQLRAHLHWLVKSLGQELYHRK